MSPFQGLNNWRCTYQYLLAARNTEHATASIAIHALEHISTICQGSLMNNYNGKSKFFCWSRPLVMGDASVEMISQVVFYRLYTDHHCRHAR